MRGGRPALLEGERDSHEAMASGRSAQDLTGKRPVRHSGSARTLDQLAEPAPRLVLLLPGQHLLASGVRVLALAEDNADRRTFQLVALAEEILQVTLVRRRDVPGGTLMLHCGAKISIPFPRK